MAAAARRLARDQHEIATQPLGTVSAQPCGDDLFEWHANLQPSQGPLAGITFHLVLSFPHDYPTSPPKLTFPVREIPAFRHPNVFSDNFVCLDMLNASQSGPYGGWSSAYTVQSVLLQLQAFLLDDRIPQEHGGVYHLPRDLSTVRRIREQAAAYRCRCGHTGMTPTPALQIPAPDPEASTSPTPKPTTAAVKEAGATTTSLNIPLATELWARVFEVLLPVDLLRTRKVQRSWQEIVEDFALLARFDMICFHSKVRSNEAVLGVGLTLDYHPTQAGFQCPVTGELKFHDSISEVHVVLDLLSNSAFRNENVRCGVWNEVFQDFIPLVLNPDHAQRARPLLQETIRKLAKAETFEPWQYLVVLPQLMNSFVVELLHDQVMSNRTSRANSERAVDGYCAFHHLLLHCAAEHPELKVLASRRVRAFVASEVERSKAGTPDLGQFLVLCAIVADSRWAEIQKPYMQESLTRNVRRLFQEQQQRSELFGDTSQQLRYARLEGVRDGLTYGEEAELAALRRKFEAAVASGEGGHPQSYAELRGLADADLERYWFRSTKTGKRLLMYQVAFMRVVGRPSRGEANLVDYNRRWGLPTEAQRQQMFDHCRRALGVDSWGGFFDAIGMPRPLSLANILRRALAISNARSYHIVRYACGADAQRAAATAAPYRRPAGGMWEIFAREAEALRRGDPQPFASRPVAPAGALHGAAGKVGARVGSKNGSGGYKTQLCTFFGSGRCNRGSTCAYAHGVRELQGGGKGGSGGGGGAYKTQFCVHFQNGRCNRGGACTYAHRAEELQGGRGGGKGGGCGRKGGGRGLGSGGGGRSAQAVAQLLLHGQRAGAGDSDNDYGPGYDDFDGHSDFDHYDDHIDDYGFYSD